MSRLRRALAALRGFTRGFLGLADAAPRDPASARQWIKDEASRRSHCC